VVRSTRSLSDGRQRAAGETVHYVEKGIAQAWQAWYSRVEHGEAYSAWGATEQDTAVGKRREDEKIVGFTIVPQRGGVCSV
jgi:hypothetical protein